MSFLRIMVVGGGRQAYFLARSFIDKGHQVTIVNDDADESRRLARRLNALVIHGDGSSPRVLGEAGAENADVVLAITPRDEDNLVICQAAERLFGVRRTLASVSDPALEPVFRALGVNGAFSLSQVLTGLIERRVESSTILNLLPLGQGEATLTEVVLDQGAPAAGRTLGELDLPGDSLVVCIFRDGRPIIPRGGTRLEPGDRAVVMATGENYAAVLRALAGKEA